MKNKLITSLSLRKVLLSALVAAPLATLPAPLWAIPQVTGYTGNPTALNVTSNSAATTFSYSNPIPATPPPFPITSTNLQITDLSAAGNRLVLKWQEFGSGFSPINVGDVVNWTLPSATSAVLNMVSSGATLSNGTLSSNGSIFIVNPNGITLNGTVTAAGFGMSTVPQNEFYFMANGTLDPSTSSLAAVTGVAPLPATPDITSTAAINVGKTGNVVMSARNVSVSGAITAGTLTINSNSAGGLTGGVMLAQTAALTLGAAHTPATGVADVVPGYGNLTINSGGGRVVLSGTALTSTVFGGTLTVNSAGGPISQGTGKVIVGDGFSDPKLVIDAGVGTVTLGNLDTTGDKRLDATITSAGNTLLTTDNDIRLMASTVNGTLSLTSTAGGIANSGSTTVTGAVSLSATTADKDISFNSTGGLTFGTITANPTDNRNDITLVSGGSITLPGISLGGNLTVTAATNIDQQPLTAILQNTSNRRAKFESTSGSIVLDNRVGGVSTGAPLNNFQRVQLVGAPGGVTLSDADGVTIHSGTNVTGAATITATAITLGADAGAEVTFNSNLTLNATGAGGVTLVSGGTGYTVAPTFTVMDGTTVIGTGTTTLAVTTGAVGITAAGSGFTSAPTVTLGTGGATGTSNLRLDTATIGVGGTGYAVGNTFVVSGGGSTSPAIVTVATVDGVTGAITGVNVTTPGAGFTDLTATSVVPATVAAGATGATITAGTGSLNAVTINSSGSYTTIPAPTLTGGGGTGVILAQPTGSVATATLAAPLTTSAAAPTVAFSAGTATATAAGGGVYDNSNNVAVTGLLQINAPGPVVIDGGASGSAIGLNHRFGQINVSQTAAGVPTAAGVTLYESTTLNLGAITTAGKLRAYSSGGDVIDTGPIIAGSAEFGAGTAAAPGNITIDSAGTTISGPIAFLDDVALVTNVPANTGTVTGSYLANNVSITTVGSILIAPTLSDATGIGIPGTLTLNATGVGSDIFLGTTVPAGTISGPVAVTGAVTLTANDAVTATDGDNLLRSITVNAGGIVNIVSDETLTVNATLTQNGTVAGGSTATFTAQGLQVGAFNSDYTGLVKFDSDGGNDITDNVNGVRVFGPVEFTSNRHITINNTGHSFGLVSLSSTANNGNVTIVESGGLRLGTVTTHGRGNFTATSTTGDILQDNDLRGIRLGNGETGVGTFSAPLGSVLLTDNNIANTEVVPVTTNNNWVNSIPIVNATAGGEIVINNPRTGSLGQTVLGNITAGGGLTVDSVTAMNGAAVASIAANSIEQSATGRANVFGVVNLISNGAGAITLGNTGNRLGGVIARTGTGNITITESTTLNLLGAQTTGLLAATSENGSIIDSSFALLGVANRLIGAPALVGPPAVAEVPINATFNAPNGNVTLGLAASNFGSVGFTTGGNVSILDTVGNINFTASTIGGTLDVLAMGANGVISQSGTLLVSGNTTLTTNSGSISLTDTANQFGGIRFAVGNNGALIAENTTLNLRGGSTSSGPVQLVTNGDFITSGTGASSIVGTNANLTIQAQGTIIPGAGSLLVSGTFTVFSPSLKDLHFLSKAGNLFGKDPVNLGAGPYVPPSE